MALEWAYRTSLQKDDVLIKLGPKESGPRAREQDEVVARVRHRRLIEATAEALMSGLDQPLAARIARVANGAPSTRLSPSDLRQKTEELERLERMIDESHQVLSSCSEDWAQTIRETVRQHEKEAAMLRQDLARHETSVVEPEPFTEIDVTRLITRLADLVASIRGDSGRSIQDEALNDILVGPTLTAIEDLTVHFEVSLRVPDIDGNELMLGPLPFTVESTRSLKSGKRVDAMVDLVLSNAWPTSVVSAGIPLVCAAYRRDKIATAVSRRLRSHLTSKACSVLGGCEVPEVIAVVSRRLKLGSPSVEVDSTLEARIVDVYFNHQLSGPKAWRQASDDDSLSQLVLRVHQDGQIPIQQVLPWQSRYLEARGDYFVKPSCACGSQDLGYIAAPEPDGLVCLACRRDRSGVVIPEAWNVALTNAEYWKRLGHSVQVPPVPGIPERKLVTEPLRLRPDPSLDA